MQCSYYLFKIEVHLSDEGAAVCHRQFMGSDHRGMPTSDSQAQLIGLQWIVTGTPVMKELY
jgi:hypothetical protein